MKSILLFAIALVVILSCQEKKGDVSTAADTLQIFSLHGTEMSVKTPLGWKMHPLDSNAIGFAFDWDKKEYRPRLVINSKPRIKGLELDSIVQRKSDSIGVYYQPSKVISISNEKLNNIPMACLDFSNDYLRGTWLFMINDNRVISFSFMASNRPEGSYEEHRKVLMKLVASLEIRQSIK